MKKNRELCTIYIRMIEGVETFIPVIAKPIRDNTFKIISNNDMDLEEDATCIYEFFPGDIVNCELKTDVISPGEEKRKEIMLAKNLVLFSTSFPNRKMYQLIFNLVKNFGNLTVGDAELFQDEIKFLCRSDSKIKQKEHPIIKKWLNENCKISYHDI